MTETNHSQTIPISPSVFPTKNKKMTERLNHKLDVDKIKTVEDVKNIFVTMDLVASMSEDDPKYEMAKEYFTIPYTPEPLVLTSWEKAND